MNSNNTNQEQKEMLQINEQQKKFYEQKQGSRYEEIGIVNQLWDKTRRNLYKVRENLGITELIRARHLYWLGNLQGKRVLDLGCHSGNDLSIDIAKNCGFYLGMDLSQPAITQLNEKLLLNNLPHAQAVAFDFLQSDFPYESFDIIYAYGVMHHFKYFDAFLSLLHERLNHGGKVISFDPMETSLPIWLARRLYRPFQIDSDWEYPFSQQNFKLIEKYFTIKAIQGVLGYSKWGLPLAIFPFGSDLVSQLHEYDVTSATVPGDDLWRCMQVALYLEKI
jgi:2-polyprenyl-3-methyl-5-hydroxy-6-metoxy-1,4-benzoquinol methylase